MLTAVPGKPGRYRLEITCHIQQPVSRGTLGARIAFTSGPAHQDHNRIWTLLDKVLAKYPDMVLFHGGNPTGGEHIASLWAHTPVLEHPHEMARDRAILAPPVRWLSVPRTIIPHSGAKSMKFMAPADLR